MGTLQERVVKHGINQTRFVKSPESFRRHPNGTKFVFRPAVKRRQAWSSRLSCKQQTGDVVTAFQARQNLAVERQQLARWKQTLAAPPEGYNEAF